VRSVKNDSIRYTSGAKRILLRGGGETERRRTDSFVTNPGLEKIVLIKMVEKRGGSREVFEGKKRGTQGEKGEEETRGWPQGRERGRERGGGDGGGGNERW